MHGLIFMVGLLLCGVFEKNGLKRHYLPTGNFPLWRAPDRQRGWAGLWFGGSA